MPDLSLRLDLSLLALGLGLPPALGLASSPRLSSRFSPKYFHQLLMFPFCPLFITLVLCLAVALGLALALGRGLALGLGMCPFLALSLGLL